MKRWVHALLFATVAALISTALASAAQPTTTAIPGGRFDTVLPPAPGVKTAEVAPFSLDTRPVTNADFARFIAANPRWRRDRAPRVFADEGYLLHWRDATSPPPEAAQQPVTRVSWFAASAYCEARGARLPTWHEWEFAAAAGPDIADARKDPAWRQTILDWYSRPAGKLADVGRSPANFYGAQDLHGLVWEWVQDLASMMVAGDNREQGDPDVARFCGSGALTLEQKDNYATLMRIATLSSMQASYTSATMGFRCAADPRKHR